MIKKKKKLLIKKNKKINIENKSFFEISDEISNTINHFSLLKNKKKLKENKQKYFMEIQS